MVDSNLGSDRLVGPNAIDQTNPLIAWPLSRSLHSARYWVAPVWGQGIPKWFTFIEKIK